MPRRGIEAGASKGLEQELPGVHSAEEKKLDMHDACDCCRYCSVVRIALASAKVPHYNADVMHKKFHSCAVITLLVFSAYALSPLYAVLPNQVDATGPAGASCSSIKVGILWMDVVLDALTNEGRSLVCTGVEQYQHSAPDDDMVLVKKKRAVTEKAFFVNPPVRTGCIALGDVEHPLPIAFSYDIPRDLIHRQSPDYYFFSTGVSPPFFLS